jgi:hypothetical protein
MADMQGMCALPYAIKAIHGKKCKACVQYLMFSIAFLTKASYGK